MKTSTNDTWINMLSALIETGEHHAPRGQKTLELLGYRTFIDMTEPVLTVRERKLGYRFMPAEAAWILSGDNTVAGIASYSKEIARFSDDDYSFFGAYGPKFIEQAAYVVSALLHDQDTRQAVLTLWREQPRPTLDVPCTVALQWLIRQNQLHCIVTMRSSDAWLGWPYDVFNFSMMSAFILLRMRYVTRTFEQAQNIKLGKLMLTAGSQHLYERNVEAARGCIERHSTFAVAPLNTNEFTNPHELIDHLWLVADRISDGSRWLQELYHV